VNKRYRSWLVMLTAALLVVRWGGDSPSLSAEAAPSETPDGETLPTLGTWLPTAVFMLREAGIDLPGKPTSPTNPTPLLRASALRLAYTETFTRLTAQTITLPSPASGITPTTRAPPTR